MSALPAAVEPEAPATEQACNFCGRDGFVAMNGRAGARCAHCHSLERTRLLWMYIQTLPITAESTVLHVAPERQIYQKLSNLLAPGNYTTADFDEDLYRRFAPDCQHIDLCDLDHYPSDAYDLIIHSHVLEHTPCNIAYTLWHLHRMLKDGGTHLCIIPFMSGRYDESFQDLTDKERLRRFGQHDHVRRYGRDDIGRHLGKLIVLPERFDATDDLDEAALQRANIPESQYRGWGIGTVLKLGKYDMKLLSPHAEP